MERNESAETGPDAMKEQAARILFMTINWPKTLPHFTMTSAAEQVSKWMLWKNSVFFAMMFVAGTRKTACGRYSTDI